MNSSRRVSDPAGVAPINMEAGLHGGDFLYGDGTSRLTINPPMQLQAGKTSNRPAGSGQILFIDSRVGDEETLLKGVAAGTQVYVLNPDQDGLAQIEAVLAGRRDVPAISIIAHGNQGEIELGAGIVTQASLAGSAAALKSIGAALAPGGDLLLYGCDVGMGSAGQSFVDALAAKTGAVVAASSHMVGDVAAGEGWNLDVVSRTGAKLAPQVLSTAALDSYKSPLLQNAPPPGLPISIGTFTGDTSFVKTGNASVAGNGSLQLTNAATNQSGLAVYSQSFPSTAGISVQFSYYSGGGNGADGISFFLLNADQVAASGGSASTVTAGGFGGGLGYSDDGQAGITDGFLGLGLDTFGNYTAVDRGQTGNTNGTPNEIAVRGAGNGTSGYNVLTSMGYSPGIDGTRTVRVNLVKVDSTHENLSVFMSTDGGNSYQEVITNYSVNQALPNNFYLGFAASTGGSTDTHQIQNLSVTLPVNLAVSAPTINYPNAGDASSLTLQPGDSFSYSYKLTDNGPNGSSNITLQDAPPSNVTASSVHWTVQDDLHPAGSLESGTGSVSLSNINLSSGDSATVTVYGTVSSTAASGNASHTITATPGAGFSFLTPTTTNGAVAVAIGSPNPYLTGTTATATTTDTTPVRPFSTAQVADPHSSPTLTATLSLTNSGGTPTDADGALSGTGLTKTGTGTYTLSAGSVGSFNSDLQALVFTPTLHQVSSGATVLTNFVISVADGASGSSPATARTAMTTTATCFLAGTHILTERGEVVVEELLARHLARAPHEATDRVATLVDGLITFRPIRWIGGRHVDGAAAMDGGPIRIRRGAFTENVPHRDLLVTAEHCIFVDGRLIPARMLVNRRSIIEDRAVSDYSFYHIELDAHAILLAEGLSTESYLDTGNRACFSDAALTALHPALATPAGHKSWSTDACAPLAVDQATVQPIWEGLDRRATTLGLHVALPAPPLSDDPELRLLLGDGRALQPCSSSPQRQLFQVPYGSRPVRLLSRTVRPAELIGPFVDDRRDLGVAVAKLVLRDRLEHITIRAEELALSGWHALEGGFRWTGGEAALDLPTARDADTFLDVHLAATLRYPSAVEPAPRHAG